MFDEDGVLLWEQEIDNASPGKDLMLNDLSLGPDGSVFVALADGNGAVNQVVKYAEDGRMSWTAALSFRPDAVAATLDGGVVVGGLANLGIDEATTSSVRAARIDSEGGLVEERTWLNDEGHYLSFDDVVVSDSGVVFGGRWGTPPTLFESDAWLLRLEPDLQTKSELRLPGSGESNIENLRADEDGTVVAVLAEEEGRRSILQIDPADEVVSVQETESDIQLWSPYSATGYLGVARVPCEKDCGGTTFVGVDSGDTVWSVDSPCYVTAAVAVDELESLVSVQCVQEIEGGHAVRAELHRIDAE